MEDLGSSFKLYHTYLLPCLETLRISRPRKWPTVLLLLIEGCDV